jgi:hypothetical protein
MKRLYFLVPEVKSAAAIVDELLLARIEERRIHIAAKDHHALQEADLPEANLFQETDFIPAVEKGLSVGGGTGILAGLTAMTFPPAGLVVGGGAVLGLGLLGAGFGAWVSGMIGVNIENTQLKEFEDAIENGELLIMVDVPAARVDEITELVKKQHPEAKVNGTEPTLPTFP